MIHNLQLGGFYPIFVGMFCSSPTLIINLYSISICQSRIETDSFPISSSKGKIVSTSSTQFDILIKRASSMQRHQEVLNIDSLSESTSHTFRNAFKSTIINKLTGFLPFQKARGCVSFIRCARQRCYRFRKKQTEQNVFFLTEKKII